MKKSKENKGITLITVIITIILMSILATVGIYYGINSYKNVKTTKFITQMKLIQAKVDEIAKNQSEINKLLEDKEENNTYILDRAYENEEIPFNDDIEYNSEYINQFRLFTIDNLKDELDLENIDTDVLINFTTREVVSIDGVEYIGKKYYTQYKLPQGQVLIASNSTRNEDLEFTINKKINGLNCLITIQNTSANCTLSYGEGDIAANIINWETISNHTKSNEKYSVNITKSGTYTFKLQDNMSETNQKTKKIKVITTNSPKTELEVENYDYSLEINNWAYAESYVWIPRFAYNNTDTSKVKFIKGNSNIATDNTYIDSENWTIPNIFLKDNEKLTGIWILQEDIKQIEENSEAIETIEEDIEKIKYIITNNELEGEIEITISN